MFVCCSYVCSYYSGAYFTQAHYSYLQVVQGVILGCTAEESATVPTMDIAIVCMETVCALQDYLAASATCVSTNLILL